jgi:hypothetical protein
VKFQTHPWLAMALLGLTTLGCSPDTVFSKIPQVDPEVGSGPGPGSGGPGTTTSDGGPTQSPVDPTWSREVFDPKRLITSQEQTTLDPKVDILWIIDNSPSMHNNQAKVLAGFDRFASLYLNNNSRDIRMAVITTDTYAAGTTGRANGHCFPRDDIRYSYPASYARLLPQISDGIRPRIGGEVPFGYVTDAGAVTCGDTTSIRSGKPIVDLQEFFNIGSTVQQVASAFKINAKVGVFGSGDERGMESVLKLIAVNENRAECRSASPDASCLFRKNSSRAIIFVSDECDSSGDGMIRDNGACSTRTESKRMSAIANFKQAMGSFFNALDGAMDPRFFVLSITNASGIDYSKLAQEVKTSVGNSLASRSGVEDIDATNYDAILDNLGSTITSVSQKEELISTFILAKPATLASIKVVLVQAGGNRLTLTPGTDYTVSGNQLSILYSRWSSVVGINDTLEVDYLPQ